MDVQILRDHLEVNAVAPLVLFQQTLPLLRKSSKPIFVGISTPGASIGDMDHIPIQITGYGASKAALNYILRKLHFENPDVIIFPLCKLHVHHHHSHS